MLSKLTTRYGRETQVGLLGLAIAGLLSAAIFGGGTFVARVKTVGISPLVVPVAYGMLWLVLMVQVFMGILPKAVLRLFANFFFAAAALAGLFAVIAPFLPGNNEQPGSTAFISSAALGMGLAAFRVYKKRLAAIGPDAWDPARVP